MLGYPFDAGYIMRNKRALKKRLLEQDNLLEKRVALLSGATIGEIKPILELFLLDNGIKPVFKEGGYGRYFEELVFDDGSLAGFAPDVIFINTSIHNLEGMPAAGEDEASCEHKLRAAMERQKTLWSAAAGLGCPVIQNNFEYPRIRVMGNYEAVAPSGKIRFIRRLNELMADYAYRHGGIHINDLNYLSARCGLESFTDPSYYNAYKYAVNPAAIPSLCHSVASIIKSIFGRNKKALMLDLDNTLWGGVIGDDGVEGIRLGSESPEGMAYLDMQRYAKELMGMGVILGVCSKNEEAAAKSGFEHPSSALKAEDFASFTANWEPKHLNLAAAAKRLNIGADSMVFADDNPAEREIVRRADIGVEVPELGEPERFAETVSDAGYFEVTSLSADDVKRAEMYRQNARREAEESSFSDYGEYLRSLEMRGYFGPFSEGRLERVTQLANKTNQFNLTTRRYQPGEMAARASDPGVVTLCGRLEDRFGDNGIVTVIVANVEGGVMDIELWIMSCRVFKRQLEEAMFDALVALARERGVTTITGSYYRTAKNGIVAEFYGSLGFEKIRQEGEDSFWSYTIPDDYENKNNSIEVHYEQG
jgi:FkbH-like protein